MKLHKYVYKPLQITDIRLSALIKRIFLYSMWPEVCGHLTETSLTYKEINNVFINIRHYQDSWWAGDQPRLCPGLCAAIACGHRSGKAADWGSHSWTSKECIMVRKLVIETAQPFLKLDILELETERSCSNCWLQRVLPCNSNASCWEQSV